MVIGAAFGGLRQMDGADGSVNQQQKLRKSGLLHKVLAVSSGVRNFTDIV